MSNKVYDILKYVALIGLPAFAVLVGTIGQATGFESTDLVVTIITAVDVFLGSLLQVSTSSYNKKD